MIRAKVIADSISPAGVRLTTVEADIHRFVLAEFNTHRVFSRNSASSRAIPLKQRIEAVRTDPALPIEWGREQKGMQAGEPLHYNAVGLCQQHWRRAAQQAADVAERLAEIGLHKQVAARILEPFLWHRVIISATDWAGFFAQRCSPLAQPEMRAAAEAIRAAMAISEPKLVWYGEWHLPYVDDIEKTGTSLAMSREDARKLFVALAMSREDARKLSVARCARVSYLTEGKRDVDADLALFDRLLGARPVHASPFEHVATPAMPDLIPAGNFRGWFQLRHTLNLDALITEAVG